MEELRVAEQQRIDNSHFTEQELQRQVKELQDGLTSQQAATITTNQTASVSRMKVPKPEPF